MSKWSWVAAVVGAVSLAGCAATTATSGADDPRLVRGQYLVTIMDCTGCHTGGSLGGKPDPARYLAGSDVGFGTPGGIVYPPNLTPDPETGLGRWTDAEILRAIKQGQNREGHALIPVMPWASYAVLTEEDGQAIVAYLRTIKPVRFKAPARTRPGDQPTAPYLTITRPQ